MAQAKQQAHPHPHPHPHPAMTLEEWRRLVASQLGIVPLNDVLPQVADPVALAAGLEKIQGWGAPPYVLAVESVPIPPDFLVTQDVATYIWSKPSNPRVAIRATEDRIALEPDRIIADLQSNWITAHN